MDRAKFIIIHIKNKIFVKNKNKNKKPNMLSTHKIKIFVIQYFQRNTKLFFKRYWNTKRFIYKRKNEKKEEKSESFCLRENVYCVVDLFI